MKQKKGEKTRKLSCQHQARRDTTQQSGTSGKRVAAMKVPLASIRLWLIIIQQSRRVVVLIKINVIVVVIIFFIFVAFPLPHIFHLIIHVLINQLSLNIFLLLLLLLLILLLLVLLLQLRLKRHEATV